MIKGFNKKNFSGGIKKKKPREWRNEAVWGIVPEFKLEKKEYIHKNHSHKYNYNRAK